MGVSINQTVAAALKDALGFIAETERKDLTELDVAVRTSIGIDKRFYLDVEDGKLLITPESYYKRTEKNEIIKEWLNALYDDAIAEAKGTIANERVWANGSGSDAEAALHLSNIDIHEEYIEVLKNLKTKI